MKKLKIFFAFLLIFSLQGCAFDDPKYIHFNEKESNDYYTKEIFSKILNNTDYSIEVFNTNLYKSMPISDDEKKVIESFLRSLSSENYKDYEDIKEKEPYQIRIKFDNNSKYLFKIYNNKTVSLSPWDGIFNEDIIDMVDVPTRFNLYDFCEHINHEAKLNQ